MNHQPKRIQSGIIKEPLGEFSQTFLLAALPFERFGGLIEATFSSKTLNIKNNTLPLNCNI